MTRILTLMLPLLLAGMVVSAAPITYNVQVDTPNFGSTGWIDFSFTRGIIGTPQAAVASITNFQQTGFTLDAVTQTSGPGVTGTLSTPPVAIPNDEGAANFFTQHVSSWGSSFSFLVTFSGPALSGASSDSSVFRVTLFDEGFTPFVDPLGDGSVANMTIHPNGTVSALGSTFDGGSASAAATAAPEPGTFLAGAGVLAGLVFRRLRART